jgi:hypothetical protein
MQKARHLRRAQVREETPHAYGKAKTTMIRGREVCSNSHRATRFSNAEDFHVSMVHSYRPAVQLVGGTEDQFFFGQKLKRTVTFQIDRVSEIALYRGEYGNDHAVFMITGCFDSIANRELRHRKLLQESSTQSSHRSAERRLPITRREQIILDSIIPSTSSFSGTENAIAIHRESKASDSVDPLDTDSTRGELIRWRYSRRQTDGPCAYIP